MGKKKIGRPTWFKLFLSKKEILEAVSDECAGKAIKASLRYLASGSLPEDLDPVAAVVFAAIKPDVDEAFDTYHKASKAGKAGNEKRWGKQVSPPDTSRYQAIPGDRVVSGSIEKLDARSIYTAEGTCAAPGLEAGERQDVYAPPLQLSNGGTKQ